MGTKKYEHLGVPTNTHTHSLSPTAAEAMQTKVQRALGEDGNVDSPLAFGKWMESGWIDEDFVNL